jgi:hypothetical protein
MWEHFQFHVISVVNIQPTKDQVYFSPIHKKQTPWSESASDRRWTMKFVPISADRGCHVVSMMETLGHILGILDRLG